MTLARLFITWIVVSVIGLVILIAVFFIGIKYVMAQTPTPPPTLEQLQTQQQIEVLQYQNADLNMKVLLPLIQARQKVIDQMKAEQLKALDAKAVPAKKEK